METERAARLEEIINFDNNMKLSNFAEKLELACTKTIESGFVTKDLAVLMHRDEWLDTEKFISKIHDAFLGIKN